MEPYPDSVAHLVDELERLELVLRLHLEEWWDRNGEAVDEFRGLYVSDETVDGLLRSVDADGRSGTDTGDRARASGNRELLDEIERTDEAIRERERLTVSTGRDLRLPRLVDRFGLEDRHRDALLLALAPELDRRYETVYSYLQDDVTRTRPTVDLVLRVLCRSERERLEARRLFSRDSRLVRNRLVRLSPDDGTPRPSRVLSVDERVADFLVGGDDLAADLVGFAEILYLGGGTADAVETLGGAAAIRRQESPHGVRRNRGDGVGGRFGSRGGVGSGWTDRRRGGDGVGGSGSDTGDGVGGGGSDTGNGVGGSGSDTGNGVGSADGETRPPMTYLHGPYGSGKEARVVAACAEAGTPILKADARAMAAEDVTEGLRLLIREAHLQGAALYVTDLTAAAEAKAEIELAPFVAGLDSFDGPVYLSGERPLPPRLHLRVTRHELGTVHLPVPAYERRKALWGRVDGLPEDVDAAELAATFRFTAGQIADAVSTARRFADGEVLSRDALYRGCRAQSSEALDSLARRVEPAYSWDDIVLPPDRLEHLHEVAARIRHQGTVYSDWGFAGKFTLGNGLNVLFTGPSGTGKTMAAEVIARDAGLDLYKIDLSSVVSKYIGETEKNLGRIFDEAENTDAVLFFDEADALFGKRSEVKDSHDRYANIEVNYLLQRVEEHDGTVILTTNFKQNVDDAFLRRIHLSVDFPRPDRESREAIWRIIFPEATPVDDLDYEFLSSLEITGGNIRNVALTAAFMAAEDGATVGMAHVVRAVRREFQKAGKLIRPEEFGRYRTLLTR